MSDGSTETVVVVVVEVQRNAIGVEEQYSVFVIEAVVVRHYGTAAEVARTCVLDQSVGNLSSDAGTAG